MSKMKMRQISHMLIEHSKLMIPRVMRFKLIKTWISPPKKKVTQTLVTMHKA